jgi:hypothetical protein
LRGGKDTAVTRYLKSAQGTGGGSPKAVPEGKKYALVVIYSIVFGSTSEYTTTGCNYCKFDQNINVLDDV